MGRSITVVLTGASSGIGAALTRALAKDGHRLFIAARRPDLLRHVSENGRIASWHQVDVADRLQIESFATKVSQAASCVDAVICCAGAYGPIGTVADVDPSEWWGAVQSNLFGTFMTIHQFIPMMTSGDGRIITFSGGGAFNALPRYSAYAASKSAIVRLTETFAEELRPKNISVNSVAPGFVATEIHRSTLEAGPASAGPEFFEMTKNKLASGSVPIDVPIDCVRFLLSPEARGLTGKTLSASFDPWNKPNFVSAIEALNHSDLYTMRRMNIINLPGEKIAALLSDNPRERDMK